VHEILYTDSQDTLVLSSTVASRYYSCCTDGNHNPGNYGLPLVGLKFALRHHWTLFLEASANSEYHRHSVVVYSHSQECTGVPSGLHNACIAVQIAGFRRPLKNKANPVAGREGLWGCDMSRIPHSRDNRLIDGGKIVSPTQQPRSTPQKHYISVRGWVNPRA
jgi:hypothetical protein